MGAAEFGGWDMRDYIALFVTANKFRSPPHFSEPGELAEPDGCIFRQIQTFWRTMQQNRHRVCLSVQGSIMLRDPDPPSVTASTRASTRVCTKESAHACPTVCLIA